MFLAKCVLGLLLMQMPTVWNHAAYQNTKPTNEELILQIHRLEAKVDAALDIQQAMKLRFEADRTLQEAKLSETVTNVTVTCNTQIANQRNSLEQAMTLWNESREDASFFAMKSSKEYVTVGDKVPFDTIRQHTPTNSYNVSGRIYTCPFDGTYVFFVTIVGQYYSGYSYKFEIQKDGSTLATAYGLFKSQSYYETMSATAVTRCSKGEQVWVQNAGDYQEHVYELSHFAGYKIA